MDTKPVIGDRQPLAAPDAKTEAERILRRILEAVVVPRSVVILRPPCRL